MAPLSAHHQSAHCQLLGDSFGYCLQLALAFSSFTVLLIKRNMEVPRRSWSIFALDSSKQALGSIIAHVWNVIYALVVVSKAFDNPCVFYAVQARNVR